MKLNWHLSADRAEQAALTTIAEGCPNVPLPDLADHTAQ